MNETSNYKLIINLRFILILVIFSLFTHKAYADCFGGAKFGDDLRETDAKLNVAVMPSRTKKNAINIFFGSFQFCPEENLGRSIITLEFQNEKLYSKTFSVMNISNKNLESNKKLLFNYTVRNYGKFESSNNIDIDNIFYHWKKNGIDIVYTKEIYPNGIIQEKLTLYDQKYKGKSDG